MKATKENNLVGPCGISCGHCQFYMLKDKPAAADLLTAWGFPREKLQPCPGCRPSEGKCPNASCTKENLFDGISAGGASCATYLCAMDHSVDFCYECSEFPCDKLQPCADMADKLPHNMKLFYLCYIKQHGIIDFLKNYAEFGPKYYFGKMVLGKGPQLSAEEWKGIMTNMSSANK